MPETYIEWTGRIQVHHPVKCTCWIVPEKYWTTHYGAVEPGSTHEWNPDCRMHPADDGAELIDLPPDNAITNDEVFTL